MLVDSAICEAGEGGILCARIILLYHCESDGLLDNIYRIISVSQLRLCHTVANC